MKKINLLLTISLFGWFGWMLGDSYGIMIAYLMAFAGSLIGVVVGVGSTYLLISRFRRP